MIPIITWELLEERLQLSPEQQVPLQSCALGVFFSKLSQTAVRFAQREDDKHPFDTASFPPIFKVNFAHRSKPASQVILLLSQFELSSSLHV